MGIFEKTTQNPKMSKLSLGILLVSAFGLVAIATFVGRSSSSSTNSPSGHLTGQAPTAADAYGGPVISSEEDLTIVGILGQSPPQFANTENDESGPVVKLSGLGRARGTTLKSRLGRNYSAFYHIPYAAPPVGELRFMPAEKPKRWRGIRNAAIPGPQCIQKEKYAPIDTSTGSEDCLHVNVYTPAFPKRRRDRAQLPVLVYIHGGGPTGNGTRYGAKYFMDEDVVLVTFEFRIGSFGGFTTGTLEYPGNQSYKDQVMALKWVQKHIKKFGGDSKKVTLFGNSFGAISVHFHILSSMSSGLFSKAIMESGSAILRPKELFTQRPADISHLLASELECGPHWNESDFSPLMKCMRQVDASKIALSLLHQVLSGIYIESIPSNGDLSQTFLSDSPWDLMNDGSRVNNVPLIVGVNSQEQIGGELIDYLLTENGTKELNENWNEILPPFLFVDDPNGYISEDFRQTYFGNESIQNETRFGLYDLMSDRYIHPIRLGGLVHAEQTGAPVYFYYMTKLPSKTYGQRVQQIFPPPYGPNHADELQYIFLYDDYPEIGVNSEWYPISKMMVKLWVSFASTGQPTAPEMDENWPQIDPNDNGMKFFELGDSTKVVEPFTERMELWDGYIEQFYGYQSSVQ